MFNGTNMLRLSQEGDVEKKENASVVDVSNAKVTMGRNDVQYILLSRVPKRLMLSTMN